MVDFRAVVTAAGLVFVAGSLLVAAIFLTTLTQTFTQRSNERFDDLLVALEERYSLREGAMGRQSQVKLESLFEFESYAKQFEVTECYYQHRVMPSVGGGYVWFVGSGVVYYYSIP